MIWHRFLPLTLLTLGCTLVLHRYMGEYAPALLLLLAFHIGIHCRAPRAPFMWWLTGLLRDLAIGYHLGVSAFLFLMAGGLILAMRRRLRRENPAVQLLLVFVLVFLLRFIEPLMAWGLEGVSVWEVHLRTSAAAAALSAVLALPWSYTVGRLSVYLPDRGGIHPRPTLAEATA